MATEKRARKKAARDAHVAAREAALRRRTLGRALGAVVVVVGIVLFALLSGDDGGNDEPQPQTDESAAFYEEIDCEPAEQGDVPELYDAKPELALEEGVDYRATVNTNCGPIEMDLLEEKAPESVANFVFLAGEGFYDGMIWHRVERDSVIQTGDPNGLNGEEPDGPGYSIADEFPEEAREYIYGSVGMANAGPGTTGSQWFVVVHDAEKTCNRAGAPIEQGELEGTPEDERFHCPAGYQPLYNIFATVDEASYEILEKIGSAETRGGNNPVEAVRPLYDLVIESIEITES